MFKNLLISTAILSMFGSSTIFATGNNSNDKLSPKEEHQVVLSKTKKVKSTIKKLNSEHVKLKEINIKKEEQLSNIEENLLNEQKEINKLKESLKQEKDRIAEKERLEKIQKEKELAEEKAEKERLAKEKAEQEQLAKEKAEKERLANEQNTQEQEVKEVPINSYSNNNSGIPTGAKLTPSAGVFQGPSGKETYYNLPMQGVVSIAKSMGIEGDYWVRDDGVKMYGDYVMVAANLSIRPRGSLIQTSLGMGIVLDTGGFASSNPTQLDIATNW